MGEGRLRRGVATLSHFYIKFGLHLYTCHRDRERYSHQHSVNAPTGTG